MSFIVRGAYSSWSCTPAELHYASDRIAKIATTWNRDALKRQIFILQFDLYAYYHRKIYILFALAKQNFVLLPLTKFKLNTHENVRYIIGSLAIIAIFFMNFRYAYHNYGIPKHKHEACATTKPIGYNHVKVATHMMCTFIEYRVEVHYKTHTYDINSVTHQKEPCKHEVIDYEYFRDFDRKKAFNAATNFAANI